MAPDRTSTKSIWRTTENPASRTNTESLSRMPGTSRGRRSCRAATCRFDNDEDWHIDGGGGLFLPAPAAQCVIAAGTRADDATGGDELLAARVLPVRLAARRSTRQRLRDRERRPACARRRDPLMPAEGKPAFEVPLH